MSNQRIITKKNKTIIKDRTKKELKKKILKLLKIFKSNKTNNKTKILSSSSKMNLIKKHKSLVKKMRNPNKSQYNKV